MVLPVTRGVVSNEFEGGAADGVSWRRPTVSGDEERNLQVLTKICMFANILVGLELFVCVEEVFLDEYLGSRVKGVDDVLREEKDLGDRRKLMG
jgi:hypothetical protein